MRSKAYLDQAPHDSANPDPWRALYLDQSMPLDDFAKAALIRDQASWSRRVLFPIVRILALGIYAFAKIWRLISPDWPSAPRRLHSLIVWGLRVFATPEANYLILRHFHLGSEILSFIADNGGVAVSRHPLKPACIADLRNNLFLQHDINLYNLVTELNLGLRAERRDLSPRALPNFTAISDGALTLTLAPRRWHNFFDVQTAVELYTPLFALFLSDRDFRRAANSLQLDESVAVYVAKLTGAPELLPFIHNRHPLMPKLSFSAGWRLMLHGHDTEALHGFLRALKRGARNPFSRTGADTEHAQSPMPARESAIVQKAY